MPTTTKLGFIPKQEGALAVLSSKNGEGSMDPSMSLERKDGLITDNKDVKITKLWGWEGEKSHLHPLSFIHTSHHTELDIIIATVREIFPS